MSNEELREKITNICFENGGVTKPMVDKLIDLIEQEKIEARAEAVKRCNVSWQRTRCPYCQEPAFWVNSLGGGSCIVCQKTTPF